MHFSLFELLLVIGCTQGIITSVLLFRSKNNPISNKFLALGILAFCLLSIKILLNTLGIIQLWFLRYIPIATELALAPLFYFYLISLLTPKFTFERRKIIHFIPFIISQSYSFIVYFIALGINDMAEKHAFGNSLYFDEIKHYEDYVALLSLISYLIPAYFTLRNYRKQMDENISDCSYPDFRWLGNTITLFCGLGILLFVNLFLDLFFNLKETFYTHWQAYFIYLAGLIYYLGFIGYKQPNIDIPDIETVDSPSSPRKLSDEKLQTSIKALENAFAIDKVYLNPTINASDLAKQLEINQSDFSFIVNQHFKKNFRTLINDLRVDEVKNQLQQKDGTTRSMLALALDCGFNSEASFYRIFKRATGMAPKEYAETANKD